MTPVIEHQSLRVVTAGVHDDAEEVVADAHHPHEHGDDGGQHEGLQILFLRVQLHVDDVVCHNREC